MLLQAFLQKKLDRLFRPLVGIFRKRKAVAAIVIWNAIKKERKRKNVGCESDPGLLIDELGAYHTLLHKMKVKDPQQFRLFLRMKAEHLEKLLRMVGPKISKNDTIMRHAIFSKERLAVTLRFFATGKKILFFIYAY